MSVENDYAPYYAGTYTWPDFQKKLETAKGVIVSCGSCEQHGHHMPLDTDNIIGSELAIRVAAKTDMLAMPNVNYGQVWSAKGFPGTICLKPDTLKLILREIVCNLENQGARNIVLISGHNGNFPILKELARELLDEYGWINVWHFPMATSEELAAQAKSKPAMMPHAGEAETSMMLYLRPELVQMDRATNEFPERPAGYPYRPMHWNSFIDAGAFGNTTVATAEYGKQLIDYAVDTMAELINRLL